VTFLKIRLARVVSGLQFESSGTKNVVMWVKNEKNPQQ
jgi:hypothetical protein